MCTYTFVLFFVIRLRYYTGPFLQACQGTLWLQDSHACLCTQSHCPISLDWVWAANLCVAKLAQGSVAIWGISAVGQVVSPGRGHTP